MILLETIWVFYVSNFWLDHMQIAQGGIARGGEKIIAFIQHLGGYVLSMGSRAG